MKSSIFFTLTKSRKEHQKRFHFCHYRGSGWKDLTAAGKAEKELAASFLPLSLLSCTLTREPVDRLSQASAAGHYLSIYNFLTRFWPLEPIERLTGRLKMLYLMPNTSVRED